MCVCVCAYVCVQLGTSPLHLSAQYGHYSTTEVLLRAGVSRDARTKVDRTPLHMAASEGHASIVEVLLQVKGEGLTGLKGLVGDE